MAFPVADTEEQFDGVSEDETLLRPGVLALCDHLGVEARDVERFPDGSLPVYSIGDELVLKLYPGVHLEEVAIERDVLRAVQGRLPVPTPGVKDSGEFDGWGYVLMERLHGRSLKAVWPGLDQAQRNRVTTQLGEAPAVLHQLPAPDLEPADWDAFVAAQRAGCVDRQKSASSTTSGSSRSPASSPRSTSGLRGSPCCTPK